MSFSWSEKVSLAMRRRSSCSFADALPSLSTAAGAAASSRHSSFSSSAFARCSRASRSSSRARSAAPRLPRSPLVTPRVNSFLATLNPELDADDRASLDNAKKLGDFLLKRNANGNGATDLTALAPRAASASVATATAVGDTAYIFVVSAAAVKWKEERDTVETVARTFKASF